MKINSTIFNDMQDINRISDRIREHDPDYIDDYDDIRLKFSLRDVDSDDFKDYLADNDGDRNGAVEDLVNDDWGDGAEQLVFVPDASMLMSALRRYYAHLDKFQHRDFDPDRDVEEYSNGIVDRSDVNGFETVNGFYLETGIGYDTNDELFSGIPESYRKQRHLGSVGSSDLARDFLDYVNSIE